MTEVAMLSSEARGQADLDWATLARETAEHALADLKCRRNEAAALLEAAEGKLQSASLQLVQAPEDAANKAFHDANIHAEAARAKLRAFDINILPAAQDRLDTTLAAEQNARRWFSYAEAAKQAEAAKATLEEEYPSLARRMLALHAQAEAARRAVEAVNRELPDGAEPLISPEAAIRDRPALPRREISSEVVTLWVYETTGQRLSPELAVRVRDDGHDRGSLVVAGASEGGNASRVIRRRFHRIKFNPAKPFLAGPRLAEMILPALRAGEPVLLPIDGTGSAESVGDLVQDRETAVEFLPVDEA